MAVEPFVAIGQHGPNDCNEKAAPMKGRGRERKSSGSHDSFHNRYETSLPIFVTTRSTGERSRKGTLVLVAGFNAAMSL